MPARVAVTTLLSLALVLIGPGTLAGIESPALPVVNIGVVVDGPWERNDEIRELTRKEILALTEGEFEVHMYLCNKAEGRPRVVEPEKIPGFGWYTLDELEGFVRDGSLVANMRSAMDDLKGYLTSK